MARSDVIRADIERIGSMSDDAFRERWGAWCREQDRDIDLMRERWLDDLHFMLRYAEREDAACIDLIDAKNAYRDDPSEDNRRWRDQCVEAVRAIRVEERAGRAGVRVAGDAFVSGA